MSDLASYTRPTLIEVMAPHCVECRAMQPDLEAVAEQHVDSVDLIVLDATREPDRATSLRVLGTPTLIAVSEGEEIGSSIPTPTLWAASPSRCSVGARIRRCSWLSDTWPI